MLRNSFAFINWKMAYRYHPEIEGLKVNEDGTEVLFNGEPLDVRLSSGRSEMPYVVFFGRAHSVGKLVCEAWNGMADNPRWCASRIDRDKGYHFTNLEWKPCGKQKRTKKVEA